MNFRKSYLFRFLSIAAVTVSVVVFMASCRKNKTEDTGYANDHATAEQTFNDVQTISDQAATLPSGGSMGFKTTNGGCATVTKSGNTITVDFGPTDCLCHDGRKRRGKIIINCTGGYNDPGAVHTMTFDNFYQNDNKVTGTRTVTNMGNNAQGQPYYTIQVDGAVTLNKTGGTVTAVWTKTRTWITGYDTPADLTDDVYEVTGKGVITRDNGRVINVTITAPLIIAYSCHWVEAGSVTFALATGQSRTLNYGDTPNCDDQATITLGNGQVRNITLP